MIKVFVPELKKALVNDVWVSVDEVPDGTPIVHAGELVTTLGTASRPGHADHKYPPVTDNSEVCFYSNQVTKTYLPFGRIL